MGVQKASNPPVIMGFPRLNAAGQRPLARAALEVFDTIEGLIPAKGNFCINGSQSL